ncbi:MAG: hypothetical protein H6704_04725 [Myxococcales bacterium]|nr:hypothetical protein [Myxococcales bacterium]
MRTLLVPCLLLLACGGAPPPAPAGAPAEDPDLAGLPDPHRPTLQAYLVLTRDPAAMQDPAAVAAMWDAVHGKTPRYAPIRGHVRWVPGDYALDVELDFADLPHPRFSTERLAPILAALPPAERAKAEQATLGVLFQSRVDALPDGNHIRLAGAAALYAADRYDGVVVDLLARRAWTPAAWHAELAGPALSDRQRRFVRAGDTLLTRGNPKFGAPDVRVVGVTKANLAAAQARFAALDRRALARGGAVGDTVRLPGGDPITLAACGSPPADAACVQVPAP